MNDVLHIAPISEREQQWSFDPHESDALDGVFMPIVPGNGPQIYEQLDQIVFDTPTQVGIRATKLYKQLLTESANTVENRTDQENQAITQLVRHFMQMLADELVHKPISAEPILPETTRWKDSN
ncbi:hypothetical protein [Neopusillimonas maritima]|uniref:Uncharacterized protein n=1 Tax=Neopusillimonas maritima TaxID=2026239 RepID=A0A3A1YU35_9BURK|nr:hypothetical protein [Neopusillimonas maritima]RIY41031.1 hypothetical protein CJP73_07745 [Neopusillimonas maritima]